jgi:hypothetical protein
METLEGEFLLLFATFFDTSEVRIDQSNTSQDAQNCGTLRNLPFLRIAKNRSRYLIDLAPRVGLEPTTCGLTGGAESVTC